MPRLNGLAATRAIRAWGGAYASLPIVAMTANAFHSDRVECLAAGMNDFVTKPIEVKELEAAIRRVMPSAAERPAAPVAPRALCNRRKLADLVDFIGVNALAEILEEFEADAARLLAELKSAARLPRAGACLRLNRRGPSQRRRLVSLQPPRRLAFGAKEAGPIRLNCRRDRGPPGDDYAVSCRSARLAR